MAEAEGMIAGQFTDDGRPIIECTVFLPRFGLRGQITFLIDISIAKPDPITDGLDSRLGRDVLNQVRMEYDFGRSHLALHQE